MPVGRACRSIKVTTLRLALADIGIHHFDSHPIDNLKSTGDTMLLDKCTGKIRMYSQIWHWLIIIQCYCTVVNIFTALHLLSIWDLIARQNIPMPTKGQCPDLIKSHSNISKVNKTTFILPSNVDFVYSLRYSVMWEHVRLRLTAEVRYVMAVTH